jgi:uncharacterized protein YcbX
MIVGTLASIRRYPHKSLGGESLDRVAVAQDGLEGDRTSAFFVRSGHAREGKTYRGKEHERFHTIDDAAHAARLATARGVELDRREGDRFFDDAPVSLMLETWIRDLSERVGYDMDPERFRSNLFVRTVPEFVGYEASLVGMHLALGEVRLRVRCPIERCVVVTYDPKGGASDPLVLRCIAQERHNAMGVYCDVLQPGTVRVGDELRALPSGA